MSNYMVIYIYQQFINTLSLFHQTSIIISSILYQHFINNSFILCHYFINTSPLIHQYFIKLLSILYQHFIVISLILYLQSLIRSLHPHNRHILLERRLRGLRARQHRVHRVHRRDANTRKQHVINVGYDLLHALDLRRQLAPFSRFLYVHWIHDLYTYRPRYIFK